MGCFKISPHKLVELIKNKGRSYLRSAFIIIGYIKLNDSA